MKYRHENILAQEINLPPGKVVCVGRNYLDHIQELNNSVPEQALLFIKPSTALTHLSSPVYIPKTLGCCDNEIEIAVLIRHALKNATPKQAQEAIWGYGLALDLTLRDLQSTLKSQGHPWERSKAFDASCPISGFVAEQELKRADPLHFSLYVNQQLRQKGSSCDMMRDIVSLLVEISQCFTLLPGDIVITGTPKGVSALHAGDQLTISLDGHFSISTEVV